jgi:hypothetical protein
MSRYRCAHCGAEFVADEARCVKCLRKSSVVELPPSAVVPAPASPAPVRAHASEHSVPSRIGHGIAQVVLSMGSALFVVSAAINLTFTLTDAGAPGGLLSGVYPVPQSEVELVTSISTYAAILLLSLTSVVWAAANAYAFLRGRPWARKSAIAYYAFTATGCCCLPLGIAGILTLRNDPSTSSTRP